MSAPRIVDLSGSPRALGRAHGEELRAQIAEALGRWIAVIEQQTGMPGGVYLSSFAAATEFRPAIEGLAPKLIDEVAGLAEGAAQDFERMLVYQLMDEEWAFRVNAIGARRAPMHACTSFGVLREDGMALLAQNMDLPSHYDGSQVVLRLRPDDRPAVMVFTPAGMIGTTGLNDRGVGVCCNAVTQLRHASSGLPVAFVIRALLETETATEAVRLLTGAPHATGQNYIVGDSSQVRDFEASPGLVCEVPATGTGQVMHTNHALANEGIDPTRAGQADQDSLTRLRRLEEQVSPLGHRITVEDARRALSDREAPICVSRGGDWMTLGSVVMELAGDPVLHVAPGPPAQTPYSEVRFT